MSFRNLENFTALFHLWCPIEVIRIAGIKSGYRGVDCKALKYCTIKYFVFMEVKFWTGVSWVLTHAMWKMKIACVSGTLVATYITLILIFTRYLLRFKTWQFPGTLPRLACCPVHCHDAAFPRFTAKALLFTGSLTRCGSSLFHCHGVALPQFSTTAQLFPG